METFWQDLRYSLRTLFKKPGFAFVVVTTLALGIGANATIFTWIKAVLLASLPSIEQPEKLVEIWGATRNNSALSSSHMDYLDYRDQNKVLSGLIATKCYLLIWAAARSQSVCGELSFRAITLTFSA